MNIHVVENGQADWYERIIAEIERQCVSIRISAPSVRTADEIRDDCDVILYLASEQQPSAHALESLGEAMERGCPLLPVISRPTDAQTHLPESPSGIRETNAIVLGPLGRNWPSVVADAVFAHAWLARSVRKVFISYKRTDSEAIANQLHQRLLRERCDVFLDDISIGYGENVQRELRWRLNDSDLLLVLASPNLGDSSWVREELAFASDAGIGAVVVRWPPGPDGQATAPPPPAVVTEAHPDQLFDLSPSSFVGGGRGSMTRLKPGVIQAIAAKAHEFRTQAVAQRLYSLMPAAERYFGNNGVVSNGHKMGDLRIEAEGGGPWGIVRVTPFRPSVETFFDLDREYAVGAHPTQNLGCYYAENDPSHRSVQALVWAIDADRASAPDRKHRVWTHLGSVPPDGRAR